MLDFLPGERFKYISVTVIDNPVPELDKVFRVELYNPDGGGKTHKYHWLIDSLIDRPIGDDLFFYLLFSYFK